MNVIDIFAWIVLVVLVGTLVAVFVALGTMPGRIARKRGHPWPAAVIRNSVQIVPSVAGEVIDVPVAANTPVKEGDVLFRIDPTTYQAWSRPSRRSSNSPSCASASSPSCRAGTPAGPSTCRSASPKSRSCAPSSTAPGGISTGPPCGRRLRNQPRAAQGRPRHRTIPGDGLHRHLGDHLRGGDPADQRTLCRGRAARGDHVQGLRGQVFTGKVETVLQAIATGQSQPGGLAVMPSEIQAAPFIVRITLDDPEVARRLPAGSTGLAAIFTEHVKASHVIRKVVLRQMAILNYVNPF